MTELSCSYGDDRDEVIVAFLYDDPDASLEERSRFETHLLTCARCQADVASLRGVRTHLARWSPPEPSFATGSPLFNPQSAVRNPHWWSAIPVWAQVAAAMLFLGVSAGIANLDVRYDQNGLNITTGWMKPAAAKLATAQTSEGGPKLVTAQPTESGPKLVTDQSTAAPWRADLAALEQQLRTELRASQASSPAAQAARAASSSDAETLRRVRVLLDESEKRQQRELALRIAEVVRDVDTQRKADLRNIDHTLGLVRNDLGVEVMKQRQSLNLLYRASQRQ
jgi:hypothetical protein